MKCIRCISYKELKEAPVSVKVLYAIMTLCAVAGIVLIMMDIFAVGGDYLTAGLAFVVASQIIHVFGPCRYSGQLHDSED